MIATPRFVFLHLHKSGGTFVNECLMRFVPGARQLGYHLPHRMLPAEFKHLPVLGLVRNPWSYYVSWYSFQVARPAPNALFTVLSEAGKLDFGGTIRNILNLSTDAGLLERAVRALPADYTNRGLNLPGFALAPILSSGRGFYSYLYDYLYGDCAPQAHIGRMEHLREDLLNLLAEVGEPIGAQMKEFIERGAPRNVSQHGEYTSYYDPTLAGLVAEREAAVIARFGYAFGA